MQENIQVNELPSSDLHFISSEVRKDVIKMLGKANSGHPGGSLSIVDILVTLYYRVMKVDPKKPDWEDRDRLVLSKGHGCPALYSVLARRGYFNMDQLGTLRQLGSILQGHPDMKRTPGIDVSVGSLGQGLSVAVGLALGARLKNKDYKIYAIIGDGEMQEGQIWEALMASIHYKLDNLTIVLDYNKLQIDGTNNEVLSLGNVKDRMQAFGFNVYEIDGHNYDEIYGALSALAISQKPKFIIAHTIKGKGVSFMENKVEWHGKAPNNEEITKALIELGGKSI
ncbi:putative transketolase N-terminal section [Tepidanaerobacter acetatoxydans Re1]|uniref:Putative transketolase N-terminal section n=1 Tax=Tepidanaerobacter acetatoxydans (strain DSM 21804 / JCM 16047 / Re1) TaxID=1209989 RepID=F4LR64_TEPAE|nr:transketolase [Tepidanaerobacter acetatoxydans]AEE92217.1 Transketolase [Tepidanaerobacter acetatoxydans Re1]CCP27087.1 putative transketolase N-terminal section [Tepidanaerobacter acetatoxydans Re1]